MRLRIEGLALALAPLAASAQTVSATPVQGVCPSSGPFENYP